MSVVNNIIEKAQRIALDLDPDSLQAELSYYNSSQIEKYLLLGAVISLRHKKLEKDITRVVKEVGSIINNTDLARYSYLTFRIYPHLKDEFAVKKYAVHIPNIIKKWVKEYANAKKLTYNNPLKAEVLREEDIILLADVVNKTLETLALHSVPAEVSFSKIMSALREYMGEKIQKPVIVKTPLEVEVERVTDSEYRIIVKNVPMKIAALFYKAYFIERRDTQEYKISLNLYVVPEEEEES